MRHEAPHGNNKQHETWNEKQRSNKGNTMLYVRVCACALKTHFSAGLHQAEVFLMFVHVNEGATVLETPVHSETSTKSHRLGAYLEIWVNTQTADAHKHTPSPTSGTVTVIHHQGASSSRSSQQQFIISGDLELNDDGWVASLRLSPKISHLTKGCVFFFCFFVFFTELRFQAPLFHTVCALSPTKQ